MLARLQRLQLVSTLLLMLAGALFMTGAITAMGIQGMPLELNMRSGIVLIVLGSMLVSVVLTLGITYMFFNQLVSQRVRRVEAFLRNIVTGKQSLSERIDVYGKDDIDQLALACNAVIEQMQHASQHDLQLTQETRLLAFNTMLDAARAGDEAHAIGMVAEQIHALAQQSSVVSDEDIRLLISRLQSAAQR